MDGAGITLLRGNGRLAGTGVVEVYGVRHTAEHVVLANGADPVIPPEVTSLVVESRLPQPGPGRGPCPSRHLRRFRRSHARDAQPGGTAASPGR